MYSIDDGYMVVGNAKYQYRHAILHICFISHEGSRIKTAVLIYCIGIPKGKLLQIWAFEQTAFCFATDNGKL